MTGFDERGPAWRSGLREGDIVVAVDDKPERNVDDIHRALQTWSDERSIRLHVVRQREGVDVELTPAEAAVNG